MPTTLVTTPRPEFSDPEGASPIFRAPPHNIEAEKALLGAILVNNRSFERVSEYLTPEHFALAQHGRIFDACARVIERGQLADQRTLHLYFEADGSLDDIGGPAYLGELAENAVTVINAGEYARIVNDLYLRRQLIALGEDLVNNAYGGGPGETAPQQIEVAEQGLYELASRGEYESGFQTFRAAIVGAIEAAEVAHKRDGGLSGVTTGLKDLNQLLGGLHRSDLVVLAGRPSMGKTALATNIAFEAAKRYRESDGQDGAAVGFFSLEMSAEQLATRVISETTGISSDLVRKGKLSKDEFARLVSVSQALHEIPFFIDDSPALSVSQLRTRARRLKRQHDVGLVVVDYLQLVGPSAGKRYDSRVQEISEITRGLKTLAKELEVPVLALSQLSRAVEQRDDKRPQLADLRESGTIEQDADVVMFIFREAYYEQMREPDIDNPKRAEWEERMGRIRNTAEVIVGKQRHGPTGKVVLSFVGEFTRFGDLDTYHDAEY